MYWTVIYADAALKVMAFISSLLLTAHLRGNTQTCIKKKKNCSWVTGHRSELGNPSSTRQTEQARQAAHAAGQVQNSRISESITCALGRSDEEADSPILCELKSIHSQAWTQKHPGVPLALAPLFHSPHKCFAILVIIGERGLRAGVSSGCLASTLCSGSKSGSPSRELIFLKFPLQFLHT